MNYFQTHAAGFVCSPYLVEKGKEVSKRFIISYYLIETRELLVWEVGLFFSMGKVLLKSS